MRVAAHDARERAVNHLRQECLELGGDGVVAVELTTRPFPFGGTEFLAVGTAVRATGPVRPPEPFLSDLSGQDFATLIEAGWVFRHGGPGRPPLPVMRLR
nr:heavy metal-binding domain-containing protein [Kibdelosporangium phytohabitans]